MKEKFFENSDKKSIKSSSCAAIENIVLIQFSLVFDQGWIQLNLI